jgi:curved DNA-binding protein
LQLALPPATTEKEKAAYKNMQQSFNFNPRKQLGV